MTECKGCQSYDNDLQECTLGFVSSLSETLECPCKTCLIKCMCTQVCDRLITYLNTVDTKRHKVGL